MSTDRAVRGAYAAAASGWSSGPSLIYDRMARELVGLSPVDLRDRLVLDLGSGTGAATRAVRAGGGRVVAVDGAAAMVAVGGTMGVAADARALPFRDRSMDAVVAAFCLNHVDPPASGLREARRVVSPGGAILASSYAADDDHPVKAAVETALRVAGFVPPTWYADLRAGPIAELATVEGMAAAAATAGLTANCAEFEVQFPDVDADAMVSWRMGMAQVAAFLAQFSPPGQLAVRERALDLLGSPPPLVRRMIVLSAVV